MRAESSPEKRKSRGTGGNFPPGSIPPSHEYEIGDLDIACGIEDDDGLAGKVGLSGVCRLPQALVGSGWRAVLRGMWRMAGLGQNRPIQ